MRILQRVLNLRTTAKAYYKTRQFKKGAEYGEGTRFDATSACDNRTGNKQNVIIGEGCLIRGRLQAVGQGKISIGDRTYIGDGSIVGAYESISIGSDVIIAGETHIYDNNNHPVEPEKRLEMSRSGDFFGPLWQWNDDVSHKRVEIQDNVWIGERCAILKGVTIGKGSIVGCNSVVTRDVPPYCIVAGNPARVVKQLEGSGSAE